LLLISGCTNSSAGVLVRIAAAKLLIEHNFTDEDTGFQGFADGDPWNELRFRDASGAEIVHARAQGGLLGFGFTELFFETSEPENSKVPLLSVPARLPAGDYTFRGEMVDCAPGEICRRRKSPAPGGESPQAGGGRERPGTKLQGLAGPPYPCRSVVVVDAWV